MSLVKRDGVMLTIATAITLVAMLFHSSGFMGLLALVGLLILPGYMLTIIIKPRQLPLIEWVLYSLGLSLLCLIILGLIADITLPLLGISHPLAFPAMFGVVGIFLVAEAMWLLARGQSSVQTSVLISLSPKKIGLAACFAVLPLTSYLGAIILNNGGSAFLSVLNLTLVAISAIVLTVLNRHVPRWLWGWATFCMSLALLWATSLRGWYITGHDVQLEYYVFKLTDAAKHWSMSNLQDAYNACMSITILPTVLKSLTGIDGIPLYKYFYQIIFAVFTTGILALSRRYAPPAIAFLSVLLFITFPTYITDMPMLCRQEIAYGFFILLLLSLFNPYLRKVTRRLLFILFGIGTVLSHYSTTFVAVGLLIGSFALLTFWRRFDYRSSSQAVGSGQKAITIGSVAVMIIATILWTGVYTKTSNNIAGTISAAAKSLPTVLSPKSSTDAGASVKSKPQSPQQTLDQYSAAQGALMASSTKSEGGLYPSYSKYPIKTVAQSQVPLTSFGATLAGVGASPHLVISLFKGAYALGLPLMVLLGSFMALILRKRFKLSKDFIVLAPVSIILLGLQVVLPVIDYGLYRMLQQDLIFLSLPVVLAAMQILLWLKIRSATTRLTILASTIAVMFIFLSGVVTYVTGGVNGQLPVSNSGFYYDAYYTTSADMSMYSWLSYNYKTGYPIFSDKFARMKIMANTGITTVEGLTPSVIPVKSYVVLSNANVTQDEVATYYDGQLIEYKYPTAFLNSNKDLIYSNGTNEVYK